MTLDNPTQQKLAELFPAPSLPPSRLSPQRLPGANLESLAALQDVLKDNHERYHIFFNDSQFHNHVAHRAIAIYAVGGSAPIIKDYYKLDGHIQRPMIQSPGPITEENFVDHLGDQKYYQSYVTFFSKQLSEKGFVPTLEEFVFSKKYNFQEGRGANAQPEMLARFTAGALHPLIHVGYGAEFGFKGTFVEGLALTAVHSLIIRGSLPPSLFSSPSVEHVTNRLSSLALDVLTTTDNPTISKMDGVHAFDIAARILKDERFKSKTPEELDVKFREAFNEFYDMVREYVEKWTVDLSKPGEIERKMEEVVWLSSTLYGVGGSTPKGFQPDFFLMHLVTSSLFLPSLIPYLSPRSKFLLLRGYICIALTWWIMRGRPALNIKSFMATSPVEPSIATTPAHGTPVTTETTPTPNPFLPVLQSAITHPNDHFIKIQRTFAHFDTLYGRRPAGYFKGTELEDAELLDGSLFLRASLLTADSVGWVREGKEVGEFTRKGFYV